MTPARARGAAPKTDAASAVSPAAGWSVSWRYQSTNPRMPAWTIRPTHDRSSALSSRNHGMAESIRAIADVLSAPVARCSASAARLRGADVAGRGTTSR